MDDNPMSRRLHLNIAILVATLAGSLSPLQAAEPSLKPLYPGLTPACPCESLTNLSVLNTVIESAVVDASNRMCRVTAIVTHPPAGDRVTVWIGLPLTDWNGRFQGTGGGGFLGGHPNSLRGPVRQGFSAGATDTGHEGGSGKFALDADGRQDWQAIINNAYLGIHEMTVVGKALTQAFYGKAPRYSYFVGGSTGGRQGLMEGATISGRLRWHHLGVSRDQLAPLRFRQPLAASRDALHFEPRLEGQARCRHRRRDFRLRQRRQREGRRHR